MLRPRKSARRGTPAKAFGCLGFLTLGAIAVVIWEILAAPVNTPVLGDLSYSRTLSAIHTNTSVTINGPLSCRECNRLPVNLVKSTAPSNEPVICTFTTQRTAVTVRGPSVLKLADNQFCSLVKQIATSTLSSQRHAS